MKTYSVIGLMSGTSLDGLDVAWKEFWKINRKWHYKIIQAETFPYDDDWRQKLAHLHRMSAKTFATTDVMFSRLMAGFVNIFCEKHHCHASLIASHGQTVFHNPSEGYTTQIGNGAVLAALTEKTVVSDFRSADVALGGQGAPLVPFGDHWLFSKYDFCINLGGFANISFRKKNQRIAFDICPANFILNKLFRDATPENSGTDVFDAGGLWASEGNLDVELFDKLNAIQFYQMKPPKSLGREWLETEFLPVIKNYSSPLQDIMHTVNHHIAYQIAKVLNTHRGDLVLITGGGAYNDFLISLIKAYTLKKQIIIPDNYTVEYKEALVFAFLGLMRTLDKVNCLKSVTGAKRDTSAGAINVGRL